MPCYDSYEESPEEKEKQRKIRQRLDSVASLFCETCQRLEKEGSMSLLSNEALIWWNEHKKLDWEKEMRKQRYTVITYSDDPRKIIFKSPENGFDFDEALAAIDKINESILMSCSVNGVLDLPSLRDDGLEIQFNNEYGLNRIVAEKIT